MRALAERLLGAEPGERIRFYAAGASVMFGTDRAESCWCYVEPHHDTDTARDNSIGKAVATASALQAACDSGR